jgi:plasmid stability protein
MEDFQMPVNLSVKNAPDQVVKRLKARAARHHRSLQGELMAILEAAAYGEPRPLTPREVLAHVRAAGIATPSTSARIIRASRDGRAARRRR